MRTHHITSSSSDSGARASIHTPVLLHEVITALAIESSDIVLDATLGGGGHARALSDQLGESGTLIGLDVDTEALRRSKEVLLNVPHNVLIRQNNFRDFEKVLDAISIPKIDKVLLDLGWSSDQLERSGRGFSFLKDEPLVMTLSDANTGLTAKEIVNEWERDSLIAILRGWGEEEHADTIVSAILAKRKEKTIETTGELAHIVSDAVPKWYRGRRVHPATKTFQAIRIAVNDELGALTAFLDAILGRLRANGRVAVISFHSLEDRIVKRVFQNWVAEGKGKLHTKKPIGPTDEEIARNPRARSAKLRTFIHTK